MSNDRHRPTKGIHSHCVLSLCIDTTEFYVARRISLKFSCMAFLYDDNNNILV